MKSVPLTVVDRLMTAVTARDAESVAACFSADAIVEGAWADLTWHGPAQVRQAAAELFTAFGDLAWEPRARWLNGSTTIEEGTWSGTHHGYVGSWLAPTGRRVQIRARLVIKHNETAIEWFRVYTDVIGLKVALGVPVSGFEAAMDTSRLATSQGHDPVRVFIRPDDPPSAVAQRRTRFSRRLSSAAAGILVLLVVAAMVAVMVVRDLRQPPAGPARPADAVPVTAASTTQAPATSPPSPSPAPSPEAPKPGLGVTERGHNLDLSTDVLFPRGSAVLTARAKAAIAEVARLLRARRVAGIIEVNGFTDNEGSPAYNLTLSRARAKAVAAALQSAPISTRVTLRARGFGETRSVASNVTDTGRARNRRVTIVLPDH